MCCGSPAVLNTVLLPSITPSLGIRRFCMPSHISLLDYGALFPFFPCLFSLVVSPLLSSWYICLDPSTYAPWKTTGCWWGRIYHRCVDNPLHSNSKSVNFRFYFTCRSCMDALGTAANTARCSSKKRRKLHSEPKLQAKRYFGQTKS